jgi:hypothetical protein
MLKVCFQEEEADEKKLLAKEAEQQELQVEEPQQQTEGAEPQEVKDSVAN